MRKPPQIRITENDRAEYTRLARNTKAKVRRTFKNYGIDISGEIDIPALEQFQTRKQFNEWKEKAESITNRHNQHYQFVKNDFGVVASKVEINKAKRDTKRAQELAKKEIASVENLPFSQGGTVGSRLAMFGERGNPTGISVPKDFNFKKMKTRKDFERASQRMKEKANPQHYDRRKMQMKENFMEILGLSFHSQADELIELIRQIPPDDFYEIYLMDNDVFDFRLYDSEGQTVDADEGTLHQMLSYIKDYHVGKLNMDLKGF